MSDTLPVVHVDIVRAGVSLITGPSFSGRVGRQHDGRHMVEDVDSETVVSENVTGSSARILHGRAARLLAAHHGLAEGTFTVDVAFDPATR
jgi:hypothetical protein